MLETVWKPTLYGFSTCKKFAETFRLNRDDLIPSNAYIYEPYFGYTKNLNCYVISQGKCGVGEPTDVVMGAIPADAAKTSCKWVIAIGGSTVIDIAKVLAVSDGEGVDDLYDKTPDLGKKRGPVIVPTTYGTGGEVANISIMARTRIRTKLGLVSPAMYTDYVVLIPQLLEDLPFRVFAASSIDTPTHAVESALSPKTTPYTKFFGYEAIEMIIRGYQTIAKKGLESCFSLLNDFLLASNYAGLAFGTVGCAVVHATNYPLGGKYHVTHGESDYAMFTGVLKDYIGFRRDGEIAILNQYLADLLGCTPDVIYNELERLLGQILPKRPLHEYGVTRRDLPISVHSVVTGQGHLMANSFIPLDETRVLKVYQELFQDHSSPGCLSPPWRTGIAGGNPSDRGSGTGRNDKRRRLSQRL